MKRKFYPASRDDRAFFWVMVFGAIFAPWAFVKGDISYGYVMCGVFFGGFLSCYVFQDTSERGKPNPYQSAVALVLAMSKQLSWLSAFLEKEQHKIAETESTLSQLRDKKSELEPLLNTDKETVRAMLAALSKANSRNVWKERLLGFIIGLLASLLASWIFGFLNNGR
ncbi:MAG TPA: hypothetical protein VFH95_00765 [Candidatus Kapabacteria bacterium]|nr:hypothetical protein [Candidatus Kapabacteria bacterium]